LGDDLPVLVVHELARLLLLHLLLLWHLHLWLLKRELGDGGGLVAAHPAVCLRRHKIFRV
jgi:hypothetical protein